MLTPTHAHTRARTHNRSPAKNVMGAGMSQPSGGVALGALDFGLGMAGISTMPQPGGGAAGANPWGAPQQGGFGGFGAPPPPQQQQQRPDPFASANPAGKNGGLAFNPFE